MKKVLLAVCGCLLVLGNVGCESSKTADNSAWNPLVFATTGQPSLKSVDTAVPLVLATQWYYCKYSQWPTSISQVKSMCTEPGHGCRDLNFAAFSGVKFIQQRDGKVIIHGMSTDPSNPKTPAKPFETIVSIPDPSQCR